jgi:hypothetical protein
MEHSSNAFAFPSYEGARWQRDWANLARADRAELQFRLEFFRYLGDDDSIKWLLHDISRNAAEELLRVEVCPTLVQRAHRAALWYSKRPLCATPRKLSAQR